ncbi:flagellar hook-length control protein FliK [Pseudooceanicola sp. C21-150M6]
MTSDQTEAPADSFAAMLAGLSNSGSEGSAEAGQDIPPEVTPEELEAALADFRATAEASLEEAFPDGEVLPGPAFDDWAREMIDELDTVLSEAGVSVSMLSEVMPQLVGQDGEATELLTQAVQLLKAEPDPALTSGRLVQDIQRREEVSAFVSSEVTTEGSVEEPALPEAATSGLTTEGEVAPGAVDPAPSPERASATGEAPVTRGQDPSLVALVPAGTGSGVSRPAAATDRQAATSEDAAEPSIEDIQSADALDILTPTEDVPEVALPRETPPLPNALRLMLAQALASGSERAGTAATDVPTVAGTASATVQPLALNSVAPSAEVAQPKTPASPEQGFARNLAGQIRGVSFSEGTTRIELTPQGLGGIEIELSPDEEGRLRVVLRAENPAVLNAMRSDRDLLAGLLRDGGASVGGDQMSFENMGQGGERRLPAEQTSPSGMISTSAEEEDVALPETNTVGDGRLDILT